MRLFLIRIRVRFMAPDWLNKKIQFSEKKMYQSMAADRGIPNSVIAMHESVRLAARLQPGRVECLPRSLALADMLQTRGMSGKVVIGVAKQGDQFASHAWVELDGSMVAEPEHVAIGFNRLNL